MAGLFNGIVGSLIGAGIQATIGGIPISRDASRAVDFLRDRGIPVPPANWFSQAVTKEEKSQEIYDNIERHINGAMPLVRRCATLANMLETVASVTHQRNQRVPVPGVWAPRAKHVPFPTAKQMNGEDCRYDSFDNPIITVTMEEKIPLSTKQNIATRKTVKTGKENVYPKAAVSRGNSSGKDKMSEKFKRNQIYLQQQLDRKHKLSLNARTSEDSTVESSMVVKKYPGYRGQAKLTEFEKKTDKAVIQRCEICQTRIRRVNKLGSIYCDHNLCNRCLTCERPLKCLVCGVEIELDD
ncbi:uncharacterized protein LOC105688460 [Athalia rosae]|uniref:uncharacterized protein LOC105688460 n=1 Tax=Athalia rosae TaxID=37344 RepID=UPI0020342CCC|nr:uncharacterized protein LOC105688460 [Athalia rosae]